MTWNKQLKRLIAAGVIITAGAVPTAAFAGSPPLPSAISAGGTLPITASEKVYSKSGEGLPGLAGVSDITVYADLNEQKQPIRWRIAVDGSTKFALMQSATIAYEAKPDIRLEDLNGDGVPELLFYRSGTDTSGAKAEGLSIYDIAHRWLPLYSLTDPTQSDPEIDQRYTFAEAQAGKSWELKDVITGLAVRIPGEGRGLPKVEPISDYRLTDKDGNGVKGITAVQLIVSPEGKPIAQIQTSYSLMYGAYSPVKQVVTNTAGTQILGSADLLTE